MARPLVYDQPLVAVSVDGRGASWCAGHWEGDPDVLAAAKEAIRLSLPVEIGYKTFTSSGETPLGVTAALFAYSPGRTLLVKAPQDVQAQILAAFPEGDFSPRSPQP